jgi:hypothetical protein
MAPPFRQNPHRLSKSRMMTGLQCEKALYLAVHSPELGGEDFRGQLAN